MDDDEEEDLLWLWLDLECDLWLWCLLDSSTTLCVGLIPIAANPYADNTVAHIINILYIKWFILSSRKIVTLAAFTILIK